MPIESGAPWALDDRLHILSPEKYDFKGQHLPEQLTHLPDQDNPFLFSLHRPWNFSMAILAFCGEFSIPQEELQQTF